MPLTKKGAKIMSSMKKEYGKKKGEQVFYASANKGKISGVHNPVQSPVIMGAGEEAMKMMYQKNAKHMMSEKKMTKMMKG